MTREEYFKRWEHIIPFDIVETILKKLDRNNVCPEYGSIFKAFHVCPYDDLKIVVVGQDPYPDSSVSTGLAFAQPNLENGYCDSIRCVIDSMSSDDVDTTLIPIAQQGVLWLNSALTCEKGRQGSHLDIWRPFTERVLSRLNKVNTGIFYILIGDVAHTYDRFIDINRNYVYKLKHPSFYNKAGLMMPDVWSYINKELYRNTGITIQYDRKQENP